MVNKGRLVWSWRYLLLQLVFLALEVLDAFILPLVLLPHLLECLLSCIGVLLEVLHLGLQLLSLLKCSVELAPAFIAQLALKLLSYTVLLVPFDFLVPLNLPPVLPGRHL